MRTLQAVESEIFLVNSSVDKKVSVFPDQITLENKSGISVTMRYVVGKDDAQA